MKSPTCEYDSFCEALQELRKLNEAIESLECLDNKRKPALFYAKTGFRDFFCSVEIFGNYAELLRQESLKELEKFLTEDLERIKEGRINEIDQTSHQERPSPKNHNINLIDKYSTSIKSLFLFARANFDTIYALGINAGKYTSMSMVLKVIDGKKNPNEMDSLILKKMPAFPTWFKGFKEKRDFIKRGAPTYSAISFGSGNHFNGGVYFTQALHKEEITLEDISQVIQMSNKLTKEILYELLNKNLLLSSLDSTPDNH